MHCRVCALRVAQVLHDEADDSAAWARLRSLPFGASLLDGASACGVLQQRFSQILLESGVKGKQAVPHVMQASRIGILLVVVRGSVACSTSHSIHS